VKTKNKGYALPRTPQRIKAILLLLSFALILSGCEAKLDLEGVEQSLSKSVRRTDQLQAVTDNGTVVTAVGSDGLILTHPKATDFGVSQQWVRIELTGQPNFIDITSCPDNSMVALAVERQIWISTNNGQNWVKSDLPTQEEMLSVACTPKGDYWIVGSFSTLLHSTNQGESWTEISFDEDALLTKVQFIDAQHGFVAGEFGLLAKTEDGGQSWQHSNSIPGEFFPQDGYFADLQRGWVSGLGGKILHTTDGGETWKDQETPFSYPLYCFHAKDDRLFVFGDNGVALELDGQRWRALDHPPVSSYFRDGTLLTDNRLLAAGGIGTLFTIDTESKQSLNGGQTDAR